MPIDQIERKYKIETIAVDVPLRPVFSGSGYRVRRCDR